MSKIEVFQWNVLSQAFCNRKTYDEEHYADQALDGEKRREKLSAFITEAIKVKRIIVLHEVDIVLRGHLAVLCDKHNYGFQCQGHGYWRNGYMGSAIMWPPEYSLEGMEFIILADRIRERIKDPIPVRRPGWIEWIFSPIVSGYKWATGVKDPINYYRAAVGRTNVLLHATLQLRGERIHVWAYHMPCAFRALPIMDYHANELVHIIHEAEEGRHVLCMDGNFQPYTELYNTFVEAGFLSAAFAMNGDEPEWTNRSVSKWGGEFTGTLDYVWFIDTSDDTSLQTYEVEFAKLDNLEGGKAPFLPTVDFPSDHLWMDVKITRQIN